MEKTIAKTLALVLIGFCGFLLGKPDQIPLHAQETINNADCFMLVGDSIPGGSAVFEVPGQGFPVLQTPPFAEFFDIAVHDVGAYHLGIYDLSVEASSLTGTLPYTTTPAYQFALTNACRYVVIFPWLNELRGMVSESYITPYIGLVANFVSTFRQANAESIIVLMNYYPTATSLLGDRIYEGSVSPTTIQRANTALSVACAPDGLIGLIENVYCMDISTLYSSDTHVSTTLDRTTYSDFGYSTVNEADSALIDIYWSENPEGLIFGDGVHLNETGKQILADALINQFTAISGEFWHFTFSD
ncbi:MAG: hypothetical protein RLP44_25555 [Aggregatilineales bacterium]